MVLRAPVLRFCSSVQRQFAVCALSSVLWSMQWSAGLQRKMGTCNSLLQKYFTIFQIWTSPAAQICPKLSKYLMSQFRHNKMPHPAVHKVWFLPWQNRRSPAKGSPDQAMSKSSTSFLPSPSQHFPHKWRSFKCSSHLDYETEVWWHHQVPLLLTHQEGKVLHRSRESPPRSPSSPSGACVAIRKSAKREN